MALALLGAFVAIERRSRAPLVRLSIFRVRSLTGANLVLVVVAGGLFALFFFASLYVQEILGFDPLQAGFAFLPVSFMIGIGAGLAQQLVRRIGVRAVAVFGMVCATGGLFWLSGVTADGSYASDLLPGLLLMSFGMGNTFVPITLIATTNVGAEDAGLASGLFNTSQQVGGALGLAILSTLAANATAGSTGAPDVALVHGYQVAFGAGAAMLAGGAVLLTVLLRRRHVVAIDVESAPVVA